MVVDIVSNKNLDTWLVSISAHVLARGYSKMVEDIVSNKDLDPWLCQHWCTCSC